MQNDDLFESIKENLNGRPDQPILLGVCNALAQRFEQEPWLFRAAAILLGVFYTGFALAAYIILGLVLKETEDRTRGVFKGLFISLREAVEKIIHGGRDMFNDGHGPGNSSSR